LSLFAVDAFTIMGNRQCTGVLCYDVDPVRSVDESTMAHKKTFSSLWGVKPKQSDVMDDDEYIFHPRNKRRLQRGDASTSTSGPAYKLKRILSDKQQNQTSQMAATLAKDHEPGQTQHRPYPYHCRTMSSETAGREARTEHNLSRRSSTTTCEREDMQDEVMSHRSS
jgi:hypothetical protein